MKRLLFITLFTIITIFCKAQCIGGKCTREAGEEPRTTIAFVGDFSLRYYGFTRYSGISTHLGIWGGNDNQFGAIGVFGGYVRYKLNDSALIKDAAVLTIALKYHLFNDHVWFSPFFAFGTGNYQDYGIRITHIINKDRTSIGFMASRTMHYGITTMWSIFK